MQRINSAFGRKISHKSQISSEMVAFPSGAANFPSRASGAMTSTLAFPPIYKKTAAFVGLLAATWLQQRLIAKQH